MDWCEQRYCVRNFPKHPIYFFQGVLKLQIFFPASSLLRIHLSPLQNVSLLSNAD